MEFWYNVYSYLISPSGFDGFEVLWDGHNKIELFLETPAKLNIRCFPISSTDDSKSSQISQTDSNTSFNEWQYVTCGVSLNNNMFAINNQEYKGLGGSFQINSSITRTNLILSPKANYNYGFLFIKELKLWASANIKYLNSAC